VVLLLGDELWGVNCEVEFIFARRRWEMRYGELNFMSGILFLQMEV
jgi:hypothetical protein